MKIVKCSYEKNEMDSLNIKTIRTWVESGDLDSFCKKIAEYLPRGREETQKEAKLVYDTLKEEPNDDKARLILERSLDDSQKNGMKKGLAIGIAGTTLLGVILYYIIKK